MLCEPFNVMSNYFQRFLSHIVQFSPRVPQPLLRMMTTAAGLYDRFLIACPVLCSSKVESTVDVKISVAAEKN